MFPSGYESYKYVDKISDIETYLETPLFEVIEPTIRICNVFMDRINYGLPMATVYYLDQNKLISKGISPNLYKYDSLSDVISHLRDNTKKYWFVKLERHWNRFYQLYVYEMDNRPYLRELKLKKLNVE